jgi:hypothetical protein
MLTIAAAIALFIANGGAAASEALEPDPAAMTRSQIRAFNAKIDKTALHSLRAPCRDRLLRRTRSHVPDQCAVGGCGRARQPRGTRSDGRAEKQVLG